MKNKFTYLLLLCTVLAAGCIKKPNIIQVGQPLGVFSGKFTGLRRNVSKYDTTRANLQLVLSTNIGYSVQGDTSTVHAGSYGSFGYDGSTFTFYDKTYPATGVPAKTHLAGTYYYSWDGTNMQIWGASGDSLIYDYKFKKIADQ